MEIANAVQKTKYSSIEKVTPLTEVRQCATTGSKSAHANAELAEGQVISKFGAKTISDKPNYLTVQINQFQHIMLDPEWLQYINHGCEPNVFFDVDDRVLIALRDIEVGEELRFFYPSTEWSMDNGGFDCLCNSSSCIGRVQGAAFLPVEVLKKYRLSQHLSQRLGL